MATHTDKGGSEFGRKFTIARENGQVDKNSKPYFFEWIKEFPQLHEVGKRKFVTRKNGAGEDRHYELFAVLDGFLVNAEKYPQDFGGSKKEADWLKLTMVDGIDKYIIEVGELDGRYAMDIMKRLLDPNFEPKSRLSLSPISSEPKDGNKGGMYLSAFSGPNKLEAKYQSEHLAGMPEGERFDIPGKDTVWSFTKAATWLWEQVQARVIPKITPVTVATPRQEPAQQPVAVDNDLPF